MECSFGVRPTADAVRMGSLIGFNRLRPVRWPIFEISTHKDDGSVHEADTAPRGRHDSRVT